MVKFLPNLKLAELRDACVEMELREDTTCLNAELSPTSAGHLEAVLNQIGNVIKNTSNPKLRQNVDETKNGMLLLEYKVPKDLHKSFKKKSIFKSSSIPKEPKCSFCYGKHVFIKSECPATGRNCNKCGKTGHFVICYNISTTAEEHFDLEQHQGQIIWNHSAKIIYICCSSPQKALHWRI
ncbi:unnamed protein product [Lepeophtheirus salmonis]|uniref:(salmon louse) hypothetical protein n=1 Tax=Lepeophtheirus salmonis TaxID=72036 RepID=A0A7R8CWB1_LEPSM|nr:unnamed protein product [Lepeophtheirus salmonis]CAF2919045.1 unnamed protein product [Lepeophtheirus salmonis]